ncbi:MAG: hypothetical protein HY897_19275 [Deltaproteobacteria bacterium]|nr:hypothetical protein [Deltaproteobacteria bacterium]
MGLSYTDDGNCARPNSGPNSGPIEIRYRLAYDGGLLSEVLAVFLRAVSGWYQTQAKAAGRDDARCGSVTFAQRSRAT